MMYITMKTTIAIIANNIIIAITIPAIAPPDRPGVVFNKIVNNYNKLHHHKQYTKTYKQFNNVGIKLEHTSASQ